MTRQAKLFAAPIAGTGNIQQNLFCKRKLLTNEASVEKLFIDRLLDHLGYDDADLLVKTSIRELKVGSGSSSSLYKPDYIINSAGFPAVVVDAKSPDEDVDKWIKQCRSYCPRTQHYVRA